jgi:hypothetical protein
MDGGLTSMTVTLKRVSTEYSDREDRLLLKYLDKQTDGRPHRDALHDFAQQAARAELKSQPPVRAEPSAQALLAHKVDVVHGRGRVTLVFGADEVAHAQFTLTTKQLHQWLAILHRNWTKAQWGPAPWPEWIQPAGKPSRPTALH